MGSGTEGGREGGRGEGKYDGEGETGGKGSMPGKERKGKANQILIGVNWAGH